MCDENEECRETVQERGNKGEWAEIYVFLRLLSEPKLCETDKEMRKKENCFLKVLEVIREETKGEEYRYRVNGDKIDVSRNGVTEKAVPLTEFKKYADRIFGILTDPQVTGTFTDARTWDFLKSIGVRAMKSPTAEISRSFGGTKDIMIKAETSSGSIQELAFSIKSELASPPTLFNASQGSNFEYKIFGMDDETMFMFNNLCDEKGNKSTKKRTDFLKSQFRYSDVEFVGPVEDCAKYNLIMSMGKEGPAIVGELLKIHYLTDYRGRNLMEMLDDYNQIRVHDPAEYTEITEEIYKSLPKKDRDKTPDMLLHEAYYKKIGDMLIDMFNGMRFNVPWSGKSDVNGGYITVKKGGEVVAYYSNNSTDFKDYLLNNTKLETPSCARNKCMEIYLDGGDYYIKFPLQIRFR